jgi:hypothetical protein
VHSFRAVPCRSHHPHPMDSESIADPALAARSAATILSALLTYPESVAPAGMVPRALGSRWGHAEPPTGYFSSAVCIYQTSIP